MPCFKTAIQSQTIRDKLWARGLKIRDLADYCGVDYTTAWNWLKKGECRTVYIRLISQFLDVPIKNITADVKSGKENT